MGLFAGGIVCKGYRVRVKDLKRWVVQGSNDGYGREKWFGHGPLSETL